MDYNTLVAEFKSIYDVDITENSNKLYFDQALRTISESYPKICEGFVISVAGQKNYSVSNKEDLIKLRQIFYNRSVQIGNNSYDTNINSLFTSPSSVRLKSENTIMDIYTDIYEQHLYNKFVPCDANITDFCHFELLPAPESSGVKIYYEYEGYRTIEEVPEIFKSILFDLFSFYERDGQYKRALKSNNGNNFYFDRRGMGVSETNRKDEKQIAHDVEFKTIISNLRNLVNRMS